MIYFFIVSVEALNISLNKARFFHIHPTHDTDYQKTSGAYKQEIADAKKSGEKAENNFYAELSGQKETQGAAKKHLAKGVKAKMASHEEQIAEQKKKH